LHKQLGSTWAKIFRLAVPFGSRGEKDAPVSDTVVEDNVPVAA
jgi:hypothetical protein